MEVTVNSYFSGAGLMDCGLLLGGLNIQQSFEIDKLCCNTLRKNFTHDIIEQDITQKRVKDEKDCDVHFHIGPNYDYDYDYDDYERKSGAIGTLRVKPRFTDYYYDFLNNHNLKKNDTLKKRFLD